MSTLILFEERPVRRAWDQATDEGSESVTKCNALKMATAVGKQRLTDVAYAEQLLRLIQSTMPALYDASFATATAPPGNAPRAHDTERCLQ